MLSFGAEKCNTFKIGINSIVKLNTLQNKLHNKYKLCYVEFSGLLVHNVYVGCPLCPTPLLTFEQIITNK